MGEKFTEENASWAHDRVNELQSGCWNAVKNVYNFIDEGLKNGSIEVAVAGGYSSGKSSLVNSLLDIDGVLPTGIEPVSMINTYICPTKEVKNLQVVGNNVRDCLVKLDSEVLGAIKHSDRSNVYVSSVLDSLYLDVPVPTKKSYLEHITFIDTPGYNNSKSVNFENAISDKDNANRALNRADAIFWTIDIESGALSSNDIQFLNQVLTEKEADANFPLIIVFNKMDKKSSADIKKILKSAMGTCQKSLKVQPLDVIAYSSDSHEMVSSNGNSMESLFNLIREKAPSYNAENIVNYIDSMFNSYIEGADNILKDLEKDRKDLAKKKEEAFEEGEWDFNNLYGKISDVIIDSYDEILNAEDECYEMFRKAYIGWCESMSREYTWSGKVGFFSDASSLQSALEKDHRRLDRMKTSRPNCQYYDGETRKKILEMLAQALYMSQKSLNDSDSENRESLEKGYNDCQSNINPTLQKKRNFTDFRLDFALI